MERYDKSLYRIVRVLEYSSDKMEDIEYILKTSPNPANGVLGGGCIVASCFTLDIPFIDGKYRLIRTLEYRLSKHRMSKVINLNLIPFIGEKELFIDGHRVLIKSGVIGEFSEKIENMEDNDEE